MKQIFFASSFFELVCLAAGIDSGVYDTTAAPALLGTDGVESSDELTGGSTDGGRAGDGSGPATVPETVPTLVNESSC